LIEIALLGPTASGKSALSIDLAQILNANILSLDSLSIYKEIDIASAKPTMSQREGIVHFGIDEIFPNEEFSVARFFDFYKKAKETSLQRDKNLIIVGGTSFYLKAMLEGISPKPTISEEIKATVKKELKNGYNLMKKIDPSYSLQIDPNDSYRIEKWLEIWFQTNEVPSRYFEKNKRVPVIKNIKLYEIEVKRDQLRENILKRTKHMLKSGLIDEVFYLEKKYGRNLNPLKAIGIKETLDFLDGKLSKNELIEKISIHTSQLAKRQQTFNKTQFPKHTVAPKEEITKIVLNSVHKSLSKSF